MTTCDRIKQLFEDNNVTAYEVSVRTHISQSTLSRILNNKTDKLSIKTTDILSDYFSVTREWLVSGKGEKYIARKKMNDKRPGEPLVSQSSFDVYANTGSEQLKIFLIESNKLNAELIEGMGILSRTNESLSATIESMAKESLLKTELLRALSERITGKNGLDMAV